MTRTWWNRWTARPPRAAKRGRRAPAKLVRRPVLAVKRLEDRTLPSFAAPVAFDLGAAPNAVAVGHFEGPAATLDVVTANANGTVSVLLGKGDGTVQNPISITVGGTPDAVAVGDFLGNGLQDIAVANANGSVAVILSNGNGTFAAPQTFSFGPTPVGVAVADFNGDGKLDIVTANSGGTVSVLLGNGKGGFGAPITSTAGGALTSVAVGDFNGDGKPDVVVGTNTGLDILLGQGNGSLKLKQTVTFLRTIDGIKFVSAVNSLAVTNLRRHGEEDIVALADTLVNVLLGSGDGTVQAPVAVSGGAAGVTAFAVGDFNGDSKPDIVTSSAGGYASAASLSFLAGNGDGTFQAPQTTNIGESASALAVGNFGGADKLDLVMASNGGSSSVTVLAGNGDGTFAVVPGVPAIVLPRYLAAGDFTGSRKADLVTTGDAGNALVLMNNGNGTFSPGATLTFSSIADAVLVGAFTNDGNQDVVVGTQAGTIDVFLGSGDGTFQAAKVFNLGTNDIIRNVVAGDFNHDGRLDLAVTVDLANNGQTGEVIVLLGNGNGTFKKGQTTVVGTDAFGLVAADLTGNGKLDLATTSMLPDGTRAVETLLGNGDGTFQAPLSTRTGFSPMFLAAGDFSGNGKPALVLVDYFDTDNSVVVMADNGDGTFGKPLAMKFSTPLGFATPVVGDFFGDGKLSFAIVTSLGQVTVLRGNGDGTFQAPVNYLTDFNGSQPNAMVVADFNGDGKPDLAVTDLIAGDVSVLLNTSPKPATGKVATSTTLKADINPAVFGEAVTLTATVSAAMGTATGTVTFLDGTKILGEVALDPNGQARLLVTLAPGAHSLTASFAGIEPFTASTSAALSETVHRSHTTTALTAEVDPFGYTNAVLLTATVAPVAPGAGVPTGTVTFMEGTKVLGTATLDSNGQAGLFLENFPRGTHTVTAVYSGDTDFDTSISKKVTFTI
jgi:hypothetical protein